METLGQKFTSPANNFTLLRLIAALAVLVYHCYPLAAGSETHDRLSLYLWKTIGMGLGDLAVGTFFAVSGFLVTASYANRDNLFAFVEARALRIFPGLLAAALFCVLVVGPLVTTLPLSEYFSNPRTWSFLKHNATLVFGIQFDLPGVFQTLPFPGAVNGSLWTLPIELWMYMWVAIIGALGVIKNRSAFNGVIFVSLLIYMSSPDNFPVTQVNGLVQNPLFFAIGGFFYVNRDFIPLNPAMLIAFILFMALVPGAGANQALVCLFISYLIFFIVFFPPLYAIPTDRLGDISYGVYIYAFPVQQLIAHFYTGVSPIAMLAISLPVVIGMAYLSWRVVERPALRLKGRIPLGRRFLDPRVLNQTAS